MLTSKEMVQFRVDCLADIDSLAQEMADRMMDIVTKYQSGNMEGVDAEIMGQIVLNEMQASIAGWFLDEVFELSAELDEQDEAKGEDHLYEPVDEDEDDQDDDEDYEHTDVTEVD